MIYYPISGTLQETSEPASPYSFFSLTRKYGLREMWDEEHAKFYGKEKKHDVSDYIKPVGICVDNGGTTYIRCCFMDQLGIEHYADIQASVAVDDPEFVANVLKSLFGFNVYNNLYTVFGKALNVLRLNPEGVTPGSDDEFQSDSPVGVSVCQHVDGYPLTGGIMYETAEYNYIDFYHIVDPLHMYDGKPYAHPETQDTEETASGSEDDDGTSAEVGDNEWQDGEGGDTDDVSLDDTEPDEDPTIPMPEIVIHEGYGVKINKSGFSKQLSEEEE